MKKIITLLAFTALSIGSTLAAESKKDEGAPPKYRFLSLCSDENFKYR